MTKVAKKIPAATITNVSPGDLVRYRLDGHTNATVGIVQSVTTNIVQSLTEVRRTTTVVINGYSVREDQINKVLLTREKLEEIEAA